MKPHLPTEQFSPICSGQLHRIKVEVISRASSSHRWLPLIPLSSLVGTKVLQRLVWQVNKQKLNSKVYSPRSTTQLDLTEPIVTCGLFGITCIIGIGAIICRRWGRLIRPGLHFISVKHFESFLSVGNFTNSDYNFSTTFHHSVQCFVHQNRYRLWWWAGCCSCGSWWSCSCRVVGWCCKMSSITLWTRGMMWCL